MACFKCEMKANCTCNRPSIKRVCKKMDALIKRDVYNHIMSSDSRLDHYDIARSEGATYIYHKSEQLRNMDARSILAMCGYCSKYLAWVVVVYVLDDEMMEYQCH